MLSLLSGMVRDMKRNDSAVIFEEICLFFEKFIKNSDYIQCLRQLFELMPCSDFFDFLA